MTSPSELRRKRKYTSQGFLTGHWGTRGGFCSIPQQVFSGPDVNALSHATFRVLMVLVRQYNGRNNGDLCATEKEMSAFGITSPDTINRAIKELLKRGLIVKTRHGGYSGKDGKRKPALYALTWLPVDDIDQCENGMWVSKIKGTRSALRMSFDTPFSGNIQYEAT